MPAARFHANAPAREARVISTAKSPTCCGTACATIATVVVSPSAAASEEGGGDDHAVAEAVHAVADQDHEARAAAVSVRVQRVVVPGLLRVLAVLGVAVRVTPQHELLQQEEREQSGEHRRHHHRRRSVLERVRQDLDERPSKRPRRTTRGARSSSTKAASVSPPPLWRGGRLPGSRDGLSVSCVARYRSRVDPRDERRPVFAAIEMEARSIAVQFMRRRPAHHARAASASRPGRRHLLAGAAAARIARRSRRRRPPRRRRPANRAGPIRVRSGGDADVTVASADSSIARGEAAPPACADADDGARAIRVSEQHRQVRTVIGNPAS